MNSVDIITLLAPINLLDAAVTLSTSSSTIGKLLAKARLYSLASTKLRVPQVIPNAKVLTTTTQRVKEPS